MSSQRSSHWVSCADAADTERSRLVLMPNTPQPIPIQPLGSYVAKRCPLRVPLDRVKPGIPLEPAPDVQLRLDQGVAFEEAIVAGLREIAQADWTFIDFEFEFRRDMAIRLTIRQGPMLKH